MNHQEAHIASAFYCSPFEEAMCLSNDGYGDELSAALAPGHRNAGIQVFETRGVGESLGRFYSVMTSYLGFEVAGFVRIGGTGSRPSSTWMEACESRP